MGLFNWGALPKAQDDPQTIIEAVNEAIATHESDPTAHLGDGESLQQHKSNEVIDHLAGSVKNDKMSFFDFYYDLKFSDYALWSKYKAGGTQSFFQYLSGIYFETYPSTGAYYNRLYKYHINYFPSPATYYLSANILSENIPHSSQYWSFGFFYSSLAKDRVSGFKYKAGKFYASLFKFSGPVSTDHELTGVNLFDNVEHYLRFFYIASEQKYKWYIDGLLVYEYDNSANTFPANIINGSGGFDFQFTYDADTDFVLYNYDYVMSVDFTY